MPASFPRRSTRVRCIRARRSRYGRSIGVGSTDLCGYGPKDAPVVVLLDRVSDPHNVGAVLRSAEVFGARAVIAPSRHAAPETGALAKTASGALERQPYLRVRNLSTAMERLREMGYTLIGLDGAAEAPLAQTLTRVRLGWSWVRKVRACARRPAKPVTRWQRSRQAARSARSMSPTPRRSPSMPPASERAGARDRCPARDVPLLRIPRAAGVESGCAPRTGLRFQWRIAVLDHIVEP